MPLEDLLPHLFPARVGGLVLSMANPRHAHEHRVLAGTDCGFDTSTGCGCVAEEVVWEKMRALRAGADLATARLY